MNPDERQVHALEEALLARAESTAEEIRRESKAARDRALAEGADRLRLREEREMLSAQARSERLFRRRMQAAEIRLQGSLDKARWGLIQKVLGGVRQRFQTLTEDEQAYLAWLGTTVAAGLAELEGEVTVALNQRDLDRLTPQWATWIEGTAPGRKVTLNPEPVITLGGALLIAKGGRIRVDETFEGRMERMSEAMHRAAMEHLFANAEEMGVGVYGNV
ncbi:MAG: V-type ATP synthase subunit E [Alphaproteobacteria bacterium CG_4_10_14_0_2_um_filter_63_37]|nr:MAG: hypothetical protein AUJ55_05020 [Proteobacteria bacterium CG1_02_64_396]PJA24361.1 MAG: V-type ATP synthase subunit E [Alphaproteobacteria bacterium CG_4_10_14_0_2_um_filter_63_37]